jgi:hypothetical protein
MAKRKLTPKLKQYLYDNRFRVKQADYAGEALQYLQKLRAASKAAKKRKESTAKIGNTVIPRNSELYQTIQGSARLKKQSVSTFIKKNKRAVEALMQEGRIVIDRETSYAIDDISRLPKRSKIFINGEQVEKGDAIYRIQNLTSVAMQFTETAVMNFELTYDLTGNLYLELPTEEELEEAEDNEGEGLDDLLDQYETLTPIRSPGGRK